MNGELYHDPQHLAPTLLSSAHEQARTSMAPSTVGFLWDVQSDDVEAGIVLMFG